MSTNKFKYFTVTQETTVQALNKADAIALARNARGITGNVLGRTVDASRVSAADARESAEQTATA